jgi:hypothetical protein
MYQSISTVIIPPGWTAGNLTFRKKNGQIPHCAGKNRRQIPLRPGWPDIHDCLYLMCTERKLYNESSQINSIMDKGEVF